MSEKEEYEDFDAIVVSRNLVSLMSGVQFPFVYLISFHQVGEDWEAWIGTLKDDNRIYKVTYRNDEPAAYVEVFNLCDGAVFERREFDNELH